MLDALKTHANARRYDQAVKIAADFEKNMVKGGSLAKQSPSHIQAIYKADDVHKHIAEACNA
ncbi:hypothetical protein N7467_001374 [Penicillium canescens]|nr:hypothetical protein N7467_001374 [Penicillium canescens]